MASPAQPTQHYRFGVFTADLHSGELRKQGIRIKLQERPFQLLLALLERPGQVITREELRQRLWPDGTFVDFDHSISSAINKLRTVLNDSATHPRYIETVGRRGYRFLADVEPVSALPATVEQVTEEGQTAPALPPHHAQNQKARAMGTRFVLRSWMVILGIVVALAAVLISYFLWRSPPPKLAMPSGRIMLAVLPFENLTGDPGQEYFSDGLTEEMINQLGQLNHERLGVIARTSAMSYKHSPKSVEQIGRELGVDYVIEGSVRRDSNNVRIAAQLIQVKDQTHLWARQYNRELKSLLVLQGEIAQEIADEIRPSLGRQVNVENRAPASATPASYEAYDLYLKGRYFWNLRTLEGFQQAAGYFQQAIDKDPGYARAYAGLADTFGLMSTWSMAPHKEFMPKARAAALKALEVDENLAEAHTSLALIVESYDYDWQTAEKEFRRAIQLNPEYATAHHWYAEYLGWQGRFDEALQESERARQLDPRSAIIARDHAFILYYSRQYDRVIAEGRAVENLEPHIGGVELTLLAYIEEKRFAEAQELLKAFSEDDPWLWAQRANLYGRWGRLKEARLALKRYERLAPRQGWQRINRDLLAYAGANPEKLIALLERKYSEHSSVLLNLKVDPKYGPLRNDPRFQNLLHRMALDKDK